MRKTRRSSRRWVYKKELRKAVRTVLQVIILIFIGYQAVTALTTFNKYVPSDKTDWTNDRSFVAISYFGIARSASADHVAKNELDAQLKALSDHGYETISQQDIINFYTKNEPLPEKALFLAFEDGRNDSALFSTKLLEKYNFKATMFSYANKMGNDKSKFLQPKELLSMQKNGYWELGSNGYRLAYINIIDKDRLYFPLLEQEQFANKADAFYYTHYLMDFIRDEYNIPLENREQMEERINTDYSLMKQIYNDTLGYMPKTYMIMHADFLYNGMHHLVENVNDLNIKDNFELHFNREGNMLNTKERDRYNLTRVQPAPYWRTNHLLMKLKVDTGQQVNFVVGDKNEAAKWTVSNGVAEFAEEEIILTTLPENKASMTINELNLNEPFSFSVTLSGHNSGVQYIQLGQSSNQELKLQLRLQDDTIYIEYIDANCEVERLTAVRGKDNALDDIPIKLTVINHKLTVEVKHNVIMKDEPLKQELSKWRLSLEAQSLNEENRWEDDGEHIYDGIFKQIKIVKLNEDGKAVEVLYSNLLFGIKHWLFTLDTYYNKLIDWAIETF